MHTFRITTQGKSHKLPVNSAFAFSPNSGTGLAIKLNGGEQKVMLFQLPLALAGGQVVKRKAALAEHLI